MLILYTALIDDESEKLRFEEIYYSYHKRMYVVAKKILSNNYLKNMYDAGVLNRAQVRKALRYFAEYFDAPMRLFL